MRRENGYYDTENNAEQKDKLRKNRQGVHPVLRPPPLIYQFKTILYARERDRYKQDEKRKEKETKAYQ